MTDKKKQQYFDDIKAEHGSVTAEILDAYVEIGEFTQREAEDIYDLNYKKKPTEG